MKKKLFTYSLLLAVLYLLNQGCRKEECDNLDKEVMIRLTYGVFAETNTSYLYPVALPYFDITNYAQIKSVVMVVSGIETSTFNRWPSFGHDTIAEATFELYDLTHDKVIENSIITSDDQSENEYAPSANFLGSLPKEKIQLGIRITHGENYSAYAKNAFLILSRK